ncbi:tetratricopeptide repeat protein [Muriicola sp. SD30]|uniref:tetratricopeptide repeat-containing sensor histidine kinase n=1 Tax=Muriicola sp. SD30 TaxID=3240936 RepID=UPI00350E9763
MRLFLKSTLILLSLGLLSCNQENNKSGKNDNTVTEDRITDLIEEAKSTTIPKSLRDSILKAVYDDVQNMPEDTVKGKYLSKLSLAYYKLKDSINFKKMNSIAISYAKETKDSLRLAEGYWDRGAYYNWPSVAKRDSAFYYFNATLKIYRDLEEDVNAAQILRSIATVQTSVHDNTGAIATLVEAIELLKPTNNNKRLYQAYNTLGIAEGALNKYEDAIKHYTLAAEYLSKTDLDPINKSSLNNNLGLVYFDSGDFEKAKRAFQNALNTDSLMIKRPESYARTLGNLARTNLELGETATVENDLYRALHIRDSIGDLEGLSLNYYHLAQYFQRVGILPDAYVYATNARDLAREINNNLRYLETLLLLAELDPENAAAYQGEYIALRDSMQIEERNIRDKFGLIRYETAETEAENIQLSRQRLIWIGIAVGVGLLAIALFIIVDQRVKNQRLRFQQQQQEANQEIFNLMLAQKQKLEEGKQTEQKRISEELHDGILGEMNGVRMILLGLNKKGDEAAVALREQAIEKLKEVQEEIRAISHELNDASYQKFNNFISSIEDLLKSSCQPAGIDYHFTYDQDLDWDSLQGITKINIYRILQESLQNCIKHADASTVYVSFEINDSDLVITIQDNGRGFDAAKGKKGIGHKNIKSRVNKINGEWHLKSALGIGTTVLVEIPLEHISPEAKKEISLPKDLQEA